MVEMYGVFQWRGDGRYPRADAIKVYKRRGAAQAYADKLNLDVSGDRGGYVVRTITERN